MKRNAIILAAGKSNRFAPFTYEKPKGLFVVKGERLIERQIEQLRAAGITDIYVVVGFMKERYFYLEDKYGVHLITNNKYESKGNLYSLYVARKYLANTFICCADHYFVHNPFVMDYKESYRACVWKNGDFNEFAIKKSNSDVITEFSVGGRDSWAMVGHAYFSESFSRVFCELMENEINDFRVANMFWEEFYGKHIRELTMYAVAFEEKDIVEFESIEDLRRFDSEFLNNIDSSIVENICKCLGGKANDIGEIEVIEKGLTNVSFKFMMHNRLYVYRHPGSTSDNLVDRKTECYAQNKAKEIGIDESVIYIDKSGWKISDYVDNNVQLDLKKSGRLRDKAIEYIRRLHDANVSGDIKYFDTFLEAEKLMRIATHSKGNLFAEFAELRRQVVEINNYVNNDEIGKKVLCHNDTYEPNYLITNGDEMYLIDWEYAGINDEAADIACICCRDDYSENEIREIVRIYLGREPDFREFCHYLGYVVVTGYYWFCWGLYKGAVNDDDGFFFLTAYRNCKKYIPVMLEYMEQLIRGDDLNND